MISHTEGSHTHTQCGQHLPPATKPAPAPASSSSHCATYPSSTAFPGSVCTSSLPGVGGHFTHTALLHIPNTAQGSSSHTLYTFSLFLTQSTRILRFSHTKHNTDFSHCFKAAIVPCIDEQSQKLCCSTLTLSHIPPTHYTLPPASTLATPSHILLSSLPQDGLPAPTAPAHLVGVPNMLAYCGPSPPSLRLDGPEGMSSYLPPTPRAPLGTLHIGHSPV